MSAICNMCNYCSHVKKKHLIFTCEKCNMIICTKCNVLTLTNENAKYCTYCIDGIETRTIFKVECKTVKFTRREIFDSNYYF